MKKVVLIFISVALLVLSGATNINDWPLYYNDATSYNQGRHLDRTPNTSDLYVVYHNYEENIPPAPPGDVVWIARSTDQGNFWRKLAFTTVTFRDPRGNEITYYPNSAFPSISANDPGGVISLLLGLVDATQNPPIDNQINHGTDQVPPTGGGVGLAFCKNWGIYVSPMVEFYARHEAHRFGVPANDFVRITPRPNEEVWSGGMAYVHYNGSLYYSDLWMVMGKCKISGQTAVVEGFPLPRLVDSDDGVQAGIRNPSVVMSDTEFIHIAYEKEGQIWYRTYDFKDWQNGDPVCDPLRIGQGRNPQISLWGNRIFVTWTQDNPVTGKGEIVQRYRFFDNPDPTIWFPPILPTPEENPPINISQSPDEESDYAEMRGSMDWQEGYNDLWAITNQNVWDDSRDYISELNDNCRYPHFNELLQYTPPPPYLPPPIYYNIWTQENSPQNNDVVFYSFSPPWPPHEPFFSSTGQPKKENAAERLPYYSIEAGGHPYCLHRTGTIPFRGGAVDYDTVFLAYKLPHLRSYMHYPVRVVVYIDTIPGLSRLPTPLYETLTFDGVQDTIISLRPGAPETLWVMLRPELYQQDEKVILTIWGAHKKPAFLKRLDVYEVEILKDSTGGGPQSAGTGLKPEPMALKIEPSLFHKETAITYQVAELGPVSLKVFDASGRVVKTLFDGGQRPGSYKLTWHSKADNGQLLPNGIYFFRLETGRVHKTQKAILIR